MSAASTPRCFARQRDQTVCTAARAGRRRPCSAPTRRDLVGCQLVSGDKVSAFSRKIGKPSQRPSAAVLSTCIRSKKPSEVWSSGFSPFSAFFRRHHLERFRSPIDRGRSPLGIRKDFCRLARISSLRRHRCIGTRTKALVVQRGSRTPSLPARIILAFQ